MNICRRPATQSNGVLIAPIDGVHGWYLQNQSTQRVVMHLKLSGFYELVKPGEYGNEAGILPVPPRPMISGTSGFDAERVPALGALLRPW